MLAPLAAKRSMARAVVDLALEATFGRVILAVDVAADDIAQDVAALRLALPRREVLRALALRTPHHRLEREAVGVSAEAGDRADRGLGGEA